MDISNEMNNILLPTILILNFTFAAMYHNNILETIGNTPLVRLNKTVESLPCTVLAKIETTNPGNSGKRPDGAQDDRRC